jgi:hypothetical protein
VAVRAEYILIEAVYELFDLPHYDLLDVKWPAPSFSRSPHIVPSSTTCVPLVMRETLSLPPKRKILDAKTLDGVSLPLGRRARVSHPSTVLPVESYLSTQYTLHSPQESVRVSPFQLTRDAQDDMWPLILQTRYSWYRFDTIS